MRFPFLRNSMFVRHTFRILAALYRPHHRVFLLGQCFRFARRVEVVMAQKELRTQRKPFSYNYYYYYSPPFHFS